MSSASKRSGKMDEDWKGDVCFSHRDRDEYNENSLSWAEVVRDDCGGNPTVISWVVRGEKWINDTSKNCL